MHIWRGEAEIPDPPQKNNCWMIRRVGVWSGRNKNRGMFGLLAQTGIVSTDLPCNDLDSPKPGHFLRAAIRSGEFDRELASVHLHQHQRQSRYNATVIIHPLRDSNTAIVLHIANWLTEK